MERPIDKAFPMLSVRIPRITLGEFPTPVQLLENFGSKEGLSHFYIKRDDLSSSHYGGNKVRKLEYSLADALRKGRKTIVTCGAAGSNHVVATVIHGRRLGLHTVALLWDQPNAKYVRKNLLQDLRHGASMVYLPSMYALPFYSIYALARGWLGSSYRRPYFLPPGGSNFLTSLGYVNAAFELKEQVEMGLLPEPTYIFVTLGTMGTAAGLVLGLKLAGLRSQVVGVEVVERWVCNPWLWARMINGTSRLLHDVDENIPLVRVRPDELIFVAEQLGEGYAHFTPQGIEMVRRLRDEEGITLEGTYTGKTMAGALEFIEKRKAQEEPMLFWLTYNSVPLEIQGDLEDYHALPQPFHHYFEEPFQPLEE